MVARFWLAAALYLFASHVLAEASNPEELNKLYSPVIAGDTLVIKGRIDSHIYDFLSREAAAVERVTKVELNSVGGSASWALELARKIKSLGKATVLPKGNFCVSVCVYLFAAGKERLASKGAWLGIHGARLGSGYLANFKDLCFVEFEEGPAFDPRKKGCQDFLSDWYGKAKAATDEAFDFMESNGVSISLREAYFALPDDEKWYERGNVIRKPDWPLLATEAVRYKLVTRVLD